MRLFDKARNPPPPVWSLENTIETRNISRCPLIDLRWKIAGKKNLSFSFVIPVCRQTKTRNRRNGKIVNGGAPTEISVSVWPYRFVYFFFLFKHFILFWNRSTTTNRTRDESFFFRRDNNDGDNKNKKMIIIHLENTPSKTRVMKPLEIRIV